MIVKRYYLKGKKYGWYFHPEIKTYHELIAFGEQHPDVDIDRYDNAEYEFVLSHAEQETMWKQTISMVMRDTRGVLDNLDNFWTYKVRWNDHERYNRKMLVGIPPENVTAECDKLYNWIGRC